MPELSASFSPLLCKGFYLLKSIWCQSNLNLKLFHILRLDFYSAYAIISPSQLEIAQHFGLAQNVVYQMVRYLKKKGYLADSGGRRGLRLSKEYLDKKRETEGIPVVGRVAAGEPILAEELCEKTIENKLIAIKSHKPVIKIIGN